MFCCLRPSIDQGHLTDPIIFSGLKSLTLANSQQASLLRLASAGVTVYSPHSAADAVPGGLNDWLADVLLGNRLVQTKRDLVAYARSASEQREWIRPLPEERLPESLLRSPNGALGAGYGRIVRLGEPGVSLADLMRRLGQRVRDSILVGSEVVRPWVRSIGTDVLLALPPHLQAATDPPVYEPNTVPFAKLYDSVKIRSFAVCVGSGWDVLREARGVDLLVTGEMSHHAALAATERGQIVLATLHSNSERGFISDRMAPILMNLLKEKGFVFGREKQNTEPHLYAEVIVCQESDPFQIVRTEDL